MIISFRYKKKTMKKEYSKPQMEVVTIQQTQMLCSSPGASSLSNSEGFTMPDGGILGDGDDDY